MDESTKKAYTYGRTGISSDAVYNSKNSFKSGRKEQEMGKRISDFLKGQFVTSLIYLLLGLCLILMPVESVNAICKLVFGVLLLITGLYHVALYAMEKANATVLDLFAGGILLVVGAFLFQNPQVVIRLLPVLLGTFILVDSIWTLKSAFRQKKKGIESWKLILLEALIFIGLGIAMIVYRFSTVRLTTLFSGWVLLCNGVLDLVTLLVLKFAKGGKKEQAETTDDPEPSSETVQEASAIQPESSEEISAEETETVKPKEQEPMQPEPVPEAMQPEPAAEAAPEEEPRLEEPRIEEALTEEPLAEETVTSEQKLPEQRPEASAFTAGFEAQQKLEELSDEELSPWSFFRKKKKEKQEAEVLSEEEQTEPEEEQTVKYEE